MQNFQAALICLLHPGHITSLIFGSTSSSLGTTSRTISSVSSIVVTNGTNVGFFSSIFGADFIKSIQVDLVELAVLGAVGVEAGVEAGVDGVDENGINTGVDASFGELVLGVGLRLPNGMNVGGDSRDGGLTSNVAGGLVALGGDGGVMSMG